MKLRSAIVALTAPLAVAGPAPAQVTSSVSEVAAMVRAEIMAAGLEPHVRAIVRHERPSGSAGENAAIDHIVETLRAAGVPVDVHTFQAYTSDPVAASVRMVGGEFAPEAITMSFSGVANGVEAELVDVGGLDDLPAPEVGTGERLVLPAGAGADLPDVRGRIVLVTGQPRFTPVLVLEELGATGVIFVNPEERLNELIVTSTWGTPSLRSFHRLPALPAAQVKRSAGDELRRRLADGPVRVRLTTEVRTGWRPLRLAVARVMPLGVSSAPYVVFGGHIDAWHHGGTDEGASNAAMLELARAFHENRDRLVRGLVVAWWPGHSNARYGGSTWFADEFFDELRRHAVAYVNVDGIGQTGAKRFGASASPALASLASRVVLDRTGEEVRPGSPGRNSDQSFNGIGVPLLQLNHTRLAEDGGYWWWHTPEDDIDKVDFQVLETDTHLYADALAHLLASAELPVDLVAEVEAVGEAIAARQRTAGARFDLAEAVRRQQELLSLVREIPSPSGPSAAHDLALIDLLRPLHRVMHSPGDPWHPDPGVELGPLPGLAPVDILASAPPDSDRYRFAEVTLVRERNRLLEALDEAVRRAMKLIEGER